MKIVIDDSIPFIRGVFEPYADVVYKDAGEICHDDLVDASALISRTRTRCNAELLDGTEVKMIATTTIGTDHIDVDYCERKGIYFKNAAGCNSGAVMNYVFSALYGAAARKSIPLTGRTLGIVGAGAVGRRVEAFARSLGFKVLVCDPPRAEKEGQDRFTDLDTLLASSDIVSMHVPLNSETRGMADAAFFAKMSPGAFFINTSHGEIVVEDDLIKAIPNLGPVIIDAWNNEPDIDRDLMDLVDIATPHISGYSYQGKQNGTMMAVRAVARFFSFPELYDFFPAAEVECLEAVKLDFHGMSQGEVAAVLQYNYPIFTDDFMFRMNPDGFQKMRADYRYRREFYTD